ncbi:lysozyme inhibitor LprI family protein [Gymnodinialimonas sp. 2305UL16-5]|uniref:lysozyme inhibitor LprI family protein n=1 Tax=Gymnodinialimonas mytili TaxID=3126503 RepID=UPI0030A9E187
MRLAFWVALVMAAPASAQPLDCSDRSAMVQIELNACAAQDWERWDALLNIVYQRVLASGRVEEEGLRQAQRAWITYRDLTCEMEAGQALGGTIAPLYHANCLARLTQRRTEDIETYLLN